MSDENRTTPQPFDDGPRPGVGADQNPFDHENADVVNTVRDETPTTQEQFEQGSEVSASERWAEAQLAAESNAAADAEVDSDRARLDEALERSRTIPLDGDLDTESSYRDEPLSAEPNEADASASLASEDARVAETGAVEDESATTLAEERAASERIHDGAHVAPAAAATTAAATTAATTTRDVDRTEDRSSDRTVDRTVDGTDDSDVFAPLGMSTTEGLLVKPDKRSNRGLGLLMTIIATLVFAAGYAGLFSLARVIYAPGAVFMPTATAFIGTAPFYVAVAVFFVGLLIWALLANRARWWSFVLAALVLSLLVFGGYHLGVAVQELINTGAWSNEVLLASLRAPEHLPGALIAFIVANQVITWLGGLIALRGRKLTRLNDADYAEYERRRTEEREASKAAV